MDSLIAAAARALAEGDVLRALKQVALREDAQALALRGIAMAQLGDFPRSRELLRRAARGFGAREVLARARCEVAEAEVALAMRDLRGLPKTLDTTAEMLAARGDRANAALARLIEVRRWLLLGRLAEAAQALEHVNANEAPPALQAGAALSAAELALRALDTGRARTALERARVAAERAGIPALQAEAREAGAALARPAARCIRACQSEVLNLEAVEALFGSGALVVDACRRGLRAGPEWLGLARRPVLFALARTLAAAWPEAVDREHLIATVFRTRNPDDSHRARLRVEIGRLRALAAPMLTVEATARGFALCPADGREAVVLVPPIDGEPASLLALLADGAAWSTSALALAVDASQRTVQRALVALEAEAKVRSIGQGRTQRWLAPPLAGFTTILLLPVAPASG